jgi:hypothetical protein
MTTNTIFSLDGLDVNIVLPDDADDAMLVAFRY